MADKPLISVITINYNQVQVTCELLNSLRKVTWPNLEIIVVDNGSHEPADQISKDYPEVNLIRSDQNLGFAGGNNLGIMHARGKFMLFINNDTEVEPGFLEPMVNLFENNDKIGMVSPKIKFYYHPDTIQYAGFSKINIFTLRMNGIGYREKDDGKYDQVTETNFAHGCAMMVPHRVIREAGMMPEDYFLYYEEHDWSMRIKNRGYRIFYQPASVVMHKESISTGKASTLKTYYFTRNRILFARRNITGIAARLSCIYMVTVAIPKSLTLYVLKFQFNHFKAYIRAVMWHVKTLNKRFRINEKSKIHQLHPLHPG
ncbi:MAG: glycosyltransferase family 2 protein [Bacteroidales bacterium]|nr:glycosyltransferase family 2 protein [Bacteroidales bacterium]